MSCRRAQKPKQELERCGFSSSVQAQQAVCLLRLNFQIDTIEQASALAQELTVNFFGQLGSLNGSTAHAPPF